MLKKLLLSLLLLLFSYFSFSQVSVKDSAVGVPMLYATYSFMWPSGDLGQRYGAASSIGGGFMYKTASNWFIGAEGSYIFGGNVKNTDSILKNIQTHDGFLIDENGHYADVLFSERGYDMSAKLGKLFPVLSPNPNSGPVIFAGLGYLQNKIRIHTIESTLPSIDGDYRKGYDKLNGGFFISGSLGYMVMSNSRLLNFYLGLEFRQAWTKSKRDYDFETEMKDSKSYSSQFYGFRIKWMIPFFQRKPNAYYLY
jgi:hypothetical protein